MKNISEHIFNHTVGEGCDKYSFVLKLLITVDHEGQKDSLDLVNDFGREEVFYLSINSV